MKIGSLFAGIGGFDLGFEQAGFTTVWQAEVDRAAQGVLRRRFPGAVLHDDVREVGAHNLQPVDVVTFGSPCQDLSIAGKRAGLAGSRSGLFHEAARIIRELRERYGRPDFAVWENVPGAFSSNGGRDFEAVVKTLVNLGARDVGWRVLDSQFFGVAQRRRRLFVVADFGGERAGPILFESEGLRRNPAPVRSPREDAARGAAGGAPGGCAPWLMWSGSDQANAARLVNKAGTLNCDRGTPGGWIAHATAVRRLMPVECERLQGFPDGWTSEAVDQAGRVKRQADGPRYKQLGNAVTVPVAEWIARGIMLAARKGQTS